MIIQLGLGNFGKLISLALEANSIHIDAYLDLNPDSLQTKFNNKPIIKYHEIPSNSKIIVASNRHNHNWILTHFANYASKIEFPENLFDLASFEPLDINSLSWSREKCIDEIRDYLNLRENYYSLRNSLSKPIIPSLDVVITERCTLKCNDCSNLMQYYKKPKSTNTSDILTQLSKILSVSKVNSVRLIGGEPLLHPDLHIIIDHLNQSLIDNHNSIEIYTNATLIPSDRLLESMARAKNLTVYISDYGSLSRNKEILLDKLKSNRIRYALESNLTWQDCGTVISQTNKNLDYKYANCCVSKTISLLNGKIYSCPFSANLHNIYKDIEITSRDVIDLSDVDNMSSLQALISSLYTSEQPLSACSFCRGRDYSVPQLPAAIQTKTVRLRG